MSRASSRLFGFFGLYTLTNFSLFVYAVAFNSGVILSGDTHSHHLIFFPAFTVFSKQLPF